MMRLSFFIALVLTMITALGQNRIPNPSFELKKDKCVPSDPLNTHECIHDWKRLEKGTPDFLDERDFPPDRKALGYFAVDGNAFAGLSMVNGILEYVTVAVDQPLGKDNEYVFEAFIKFSEDRTNYRDVELGVWLVRDEKAFKAGDPLFSWKLDTLSLSSYKRVTMPFFAQGGEQVLIIGPVEPAAGKKRTGREHAYLLLDRVSIVSRSEEVMAGHRQEQFRFLFASNDHRVNPGELAGLLESSAGKEIVLVNVEGFTDSEGSDAENLVLSANRCHAIRDALVEQLELDTRRVHVYPKGEAFASELQDEDVMQLDRKVTVSVFYE